MFQDFFTTFSTWHNSPPKELYSQLFPHDITRLQKNSIGHPKEKHAMLVHDCAKTLPRICLPKGCNLQPRPKQTKVLLVIDCDHSITTSEIIFAHVFGKVWASRAVNNNREGPVEQQDSEVSLTDSWIFKYFKILIGGEVPSIILFDCFPSGNDVEGTLVVFGIVRILGLTSFKGVCC